MVKQEPTFSIQSSRGKRNYPHNQNNRQITQSNQVNSHAISAVTLLVRIIENLVQLAKFHVTSAGKVVISQNAVIRQNEK